MHLMYLCLLVLAVLYHQKVKNEFVERATKNGALIIHPKTGRKVWKDEIIIIPYPVEVPEKSASETKKYSTSDLTFNK